ncbi:hypothetical protein SAMN05444409_1552 [Epilithonimonas zeae]|uniref:Uncharacterized protein n=1 Tax=Epilithonimonas zeae TaxID=1416779 RepID=A0A1N6FYN1_9FLAO|nr:hypothetical protein SAMN05444409_1552 [Epilithonimonas zeae]
MTCCLYYDSFILTYITSITDILFYDKWLKKLIIEEF